jgi:ATP-dependent Clp protease ATP-binding subunit ClpX
MFAHGDEHPQQEFIQIDTSTILFICGGAFEGMEKIIEKRVATASIGFGADVKKSLSDRDALLRQLIPQDLVHYGLIPELVGRIPVVSALSSLDADPLVRILRELRIPCQTVSKLFSLDGITLDFEPKLSRYRRQGIERNTAPEACGASWKGYEPESSPFRPTSIEW